nr:immunoglobulin heavy chain junction region [Macaca mulatta]MOV87424.1 immunoglobulin heavy chain junction region [Macaca mulatta]MOV87541.1 immunoglobulin heavy chain junction region [Macaca mulatta]MOV87578.1 immunoglobulin heavy chain junction region [Macaca mulatta]MOV88029.1 immunoglobulin heavy chain junction region [Macaca mulatta]
CVRDVYGSGFDFW